MARPINSRLKISGKLVAETPLHVGGIGGNTDSDMALAINGKGELYVPGTSITGVLRAWCEKHFGEDLTKETWGFQEKDSQIAGTENDKSHASFVLIEDATIENAKDILTEIRDGVGIDRFYGTASDKAKYDREILPKGTNLNFVMTVEIDKAENEAKTKAIFHHLLEALQKGELRFGGSRTRGLGKLKLTDSSFKEQNFNGFANILKVLKNESEDIVITDEIKKSIEFEEKPRLDITIVWSPVQPLMVKAGFEGIGVDMLPLVSQKKNGNVALVLPGSSIKGALRSHAERIMRTLLDCKDEKPEFRTKDKDSFHDQINNIPLIDEIFGAKAVSDKDKNGNKKSKQKGRLGALAIDDCFAEKTFDRKIWNEVTTAKTTATENNKEVEASYGQQPLWIALEKIKHKPKDKNGAETDQEIMSFSINHHNAIDRFTGGAADGALYSVLAPIKLVWDKMQFSLDFSRTDNPNQCLMLLLLVLRDLAENRLPLGFATNRGMGEIEIRGISFRGNFPDNIMSEAVDINLQGNSIIMPEKLKKELETSWKEITENSDDRVVKKEDNKENDASEVEKEELYVDESRKTDIIRNASEIPEQNLILDPYKLVRSIYSERYQLVQFEDEGGMGAVYRANDLLESKQVAVKIIKPNLLRKNPDLVELFDKEVNAARRLIHPNIVGIADWGKTGDGNSFIIMEWLEGKTLSTVISEEKLSLERIENIFRQVCLGVAYAHSEKVLHLDLKPQNIMVFSDDYVRVIDFGFARVIKSESGTTATHFGGTAKYCSPEHFLGKLTYRSDIYSLGVTLYELFTGLLPIGQSVILAKQFPNLEIPPMPLLANNNPNLVAIDTVIEKAIKRNTEERQQSVEELLKELEGALPKKSTNEGENNAEQN